MMYMIVKWDGSQWIILHYSHNLDDAIKQYTRLIEIHHEISLLVDERVLSIHEDRMKSRDLSVQFKEIRNAHKARRLADRSNTCPISSGSSSVVQQ